MRLMSQATFSVHYADRLIFFDPIKKKVGKNSFENCGKRIDQLVPFRLLDLAVWIPSGVV